MNKIKIFRKKQGLTIKKLSDNTNIAAGYLSDLENNKSTNPTKDVMEKISTALGQTVPEIFYSKEE
ncbi:helix-turn-helix domain-containing protein [Clostridium botulinum]|uniref:helix-turn-helix domain-containing protein n=1 Tax=Clostridium botulinum TaxID=1491 RepID=UPI003DA29E4A